MPRHQLPCIISNALGVVLASKSISIPNPHNAQFEAASAQEEEEEARNGKGKERNPGQVHNREQTANETKEAPSKPTAKGAVTTHQPSPSH